MQSPFDRFRTNRRSDLARIARATGGEHTADDLLSESWIVAAQIEHRRGWAFDWDSEEDQDTLLGWLHCEVVRYADKSVRYAVKLDQGWDDDESERTGNALAKMLTAPPESDPSLRRQAHDDSFELLAVVQRSYSQASAFAVMLVRLEWDWADLAKQLWIGVPALRDRVRAAGLLVRVQPSVFDGVERIPADFEPQAKRKPPRQLRLPLESPQAGLDLAA